MKLIFLLLLVIAPLHLCSTTYTVLGHLSKYGSQSFYPYSKGEACCYGIKLSDFTKGSGLYFKVTLTGGNFVDGNLHIGGSNVKITAGNTITLSTPIINDYYSRARNAYYFYISNPGDFNYLYVASPAFNNYDSNSIITITNRKSQTYFVLGDLSKYNEKYFTPFLLNKIKNK